MDAYCLGMHKSTPCGLENLTDSIQQYAYSVTSAICREMAVH